jgi:SAM-dependent methyltransferase
MSASPALLLPRFAVERLVCPRHKDLSLTLRDGAFVCGDAQCGARYPVVQGCPVLIDESRSVFRTADFESGAVTTMDLRPESERGASMTDRLKRAVRGLIPSNSVSVTDFSAENALAAVAQAIPQPKVLVIGAGDAFLEMTATSDIVYSDVAMGPITHLIADAHDIPFAAGTFDMVISVAVMEHVADPVRCVEEIARVLKADGYVFAVTPFMQQVHMEAYDFTRFTFVGHRRLFRRFEQLRAGIANGPAMALAWSFEYFLAAFSTRPAVRSALRNIARLIVFPLKYLDRFLARKPGAYGCASSFYFFGRKSERVLSDREVLGFYKEPVR